MVAAPARRRRRGAALLLAVLVAGLAAMCAATALALAGGELRGATAWTAAARADAAVRSGLEREMAGDSPERSDGFGVGVRRAGLRGSWVLLSARADTLVGPDGVPLRRGESVLVRALMDTSSRPGLVWLGSGLDLIGWPP